MCMAHQTDSVSSGLSAVTTVEISSTNHWLAIPLINPLRPNDESSFRPYTFVGLLITTENAMLDFRGIRTKLK